MWQGIPYVWAPRLFGNWIWWRYEGKEYLRVRAQCQLFHRTWQCEMFGDWHSCDCGYRSRLSAEFGQEVWPRQWDFRDPKSRHLQIPRWHEVWPLLIAWLSAWQFQRCAWRNNQRIMDIARYHQCHQYTMARRRVSSSSRLGWPTRTWMDCWLTERSVFHLRGWS